MEHVLCWRKLALFSSHLHRFSSGRFSHIWMNCRSEWVHFHNDFFTWWRRYYVILQQIEKKFTNANELQNFKSTTYIRWRYGITTLLMYEILLLWFTTSQSITILELRRSFLMLQVPSSKITRTRPINQ